MASGAKPKSKAFVEKSSANGEDRCESAERVFRPDDLEI